MVECSIISKSKDKKITCFTKKQIIDLIEIYNGNGNGNSKISKVGKKQDLLKKLRDSFGVSNDIELNKFKIFNENDKILKPFLAFKKVLSKDTKKTGWLNTGDIRWVMSQYSELYNFNFIGPVPSDHFEYTCISDEISPKLLPIGIIFNTDPHNKPGEHWVSLLINTWNPQSGYSVIYFDSNGEAPPHRIKKFIRKLNPFYIKNSIPYNKTEYQKKDGLCGFYAINFILDNIRKDSKIKTGVCKKLSDKCIQENMKIYFAN